MKREVSYKIIAEMNKRAFGTGIDVEHLKKEVR